MKQFWMVYGNGAGAPAVKHASLEAARVEAERLATKDIGREFYVLAALFGVKASATVSVIDVGEPAAVPAEVVAAKPARLQLEVGKTYRRADGGTDVIEGKNVYSLTPFQGRSGLTYADSGAVYYGVKTPDKDLIEEVIELATPPKDDDGWVMWHGKGQFPLAGDTLVATLYRDGGSATRGRASTYFWSHTGSGDDIIAYKVVS